MVSRHNNNNNNNNNNNVAAYNIKVLNFEEFIMTPVPIHFLLLVAHSSYFV
jgi:hypothetical protein